VKELVVSPPVPERLTGGGKGVAAVAAVAVAELVGVAVEVLGLA
jgi:hypothetical protein